MRTAMTIMVMVVIVSAAHAGTSPTFEYVSQTRYVRAIAGSTCVGGGGTQTIAALDFRPFVATVWMGDAFGQQNSTLGQDTILGHGTAQGTTCLQNQHSSGRSEMTVVFNLSQTTDYRLVGQVGPHIVVAGVSLTGPEGFNVSTTPELMSFNFTGTIGPGAYTLSARAQVTGAFIPTPFFDFDLTISPACLADINEDDAVDVNDLLAVVGAWGAIGANPSDVNGDKVVDVNDLLAIVGAWGPCPQ